MSKDKQKEIFKVEKKDDDGKVTKVQEYAVLKPKPNDGREAQKLYNATFSEVLRSGGLLRERIGEYMREQGLWSDEKETEQKKLVEQLNEMELKVQRGGIKLAEAREIAIEMRRTRMKLRDLIGKRNELDVNTVEGQAENARFNALVARCLVYNETGKPVYADVDEYLANGTEEVAFRGAQALAAIMFQLDKDHEAGLPENKFLARFKFVDDELRLINKDKKLCDTEGRLINAEGRYIGKDGSLVDIKGNPVDDDGNYSVKQEPFLDDKGKPIVEETEAPVEDDKKPTAKAVG